MASPSIDISQLKIGEEIGHGAYSHVYKGKYGDIAVAIKKISTGVDHETAKYIESEIALLTSMHHPHLIQYYGASIQPREIYIVTEYMNGGNLSKILANKALEMPWKLRCNIARDALSGIVHLHQNEIVHRDIKTENILVDEKWRAVVADYGFARRKTSQAMTLCGTDEFMAPEILWGEVYDERADVFSFGVVLWEIITRIRPGEETGFMARHPRHKYQLNFEDMRTRVPSGCPESFVNLAEQCCRYEADYRLGSEEALEWLNDLVTSLDGPTEYPPLPSMGLGEKDAFRSSLAAKGGAVAATGAG